MKKSRFIGIKIYAQAYIAICFWFSSRSIYFPFFMLPLLCQSPFNPWDISHCGENSPEETHETLNLAIGPKKYLYFHQKEELHYHSAIP